MAALIALAALGLFAAGAAAGIIGMVSVAIRREEKMFTLTSAAPGQVIRAARLLNGVSVRAPRHAAADGPETSLALAGSASRHQPARPRPIA